MADRPSNARKRRVQGRSRNGCRTCRKRHRKCDEARPHCWQCAMNGLECEGYLQELTWKNYTTPNLCSSAPAAAKGSATDSSTNMQEQPRTPLENLVAMQSDLLDPWADQIAAIADLDIPDLAMADLLLPDTYTTESDPLQWLLPADSPQRDSSADQTIPSEYAQILDFSPHNDTRLRPATPIENAFVANSNTFYEPSLTRASPHDIASTTANVLSVPHEALIESPKNANKPATVSAGSSIGLPYSLNYASRVFCNPSDRAHFEYFIGTLCGLTVAFDDVTHNPYRSLVFPLCFENESLLHAVLALSALHRWKTGTGEKADAWAHRRKGLRLCNQDMMNSTQPAIQTLAGFILLVVFEIYNNGRTVKMLGQLQRYIDSHGGLDQVDFGSGMISKGYHGACILAATFSRESSQQLLHNSPLTWAGCADAENSLSDGRYRFEPGNSAVNSVSFRAPFSFEAFWGCHEDVFNFIGSTTRFATIVRDSGGDARDALLREPSYLAHAKKLERMMRDWEPFSESPPDSAMGKASVKSSTFFRDAALLYFYRVIWDASNQDRRVQDTVGRLLATLADISPDSHIHTCLVWPLFVLGCELLNHDHQAIVETRLGIIFTACRNGSAVVANRVLRVVWEKRTTENGICHRLDWLNIVQTFNESHIALF